MTSVPFPGAVVVHVRRQLLGLPLDELARAAGLSVTLLQLLERGEYDPRSLHPLARRVLERRLDISLERA
jgi:predicted transcriptional regulator